MQSIGRTKWQTFGFATFIQLRLRIALTAGGATTRPTVAHPDPLRATLRDVTAPPAVGLVGLLRVFAWIGAISFGRPSAYMFDELVRRRGWLTKEDFVECEALTHVLPGPRGANAVIFLAQALRGPLPAALCLVPYVLPGAVVILLLSMVALDTERPAWLAGGMQGLAIGAIGLLLVSTLRLVPSCRVARGGPICLGLAALAYGFLHVHLLAVLLGLGLLGLWLNRPR